ncbi:MAG: hypothetical protein JST20_04615 [Bacteroidetes bacterium]|nr:hypothetical protein [Bacteroidota bacterium]
MKFFRGLIRWLTNFLLFLITISVVVTLFPYSFASFYDFPPSIPFSGNKLYNPYNSVSKETRFIKANFHAHSHAYSGVTDGHSTEQDLFLGYKSMNYDVIGISNYQTINSTFGSDSGYVPVYEHGYNLWKRHHVCIGAKEVTCWDYLLFQSIHQKQDMIFRLKPTIDVLAIAHPKFRNSFEPNDFTQLTDYDCIEVLNHYRTSESAWDSALSAGRSAWIIADDDSHNVKANGETGVCWTMIASKPNRSEIVEALKNGKSYGVEGKYGLNQNKLLSLKTDNLQCKITCESPADSIQFIGQKGQLKATDYKTKTSNYTFSQNDTYIRIKVFTNGSCMWLNPIFRTDNGAIISLHSTENLSKTWLWRIGWLLLWMSFIYSIYKKRKSHN